MKFKDYFLNKITEILGTFFVLFLMLEFLYIIGNTFSVVFMIGVVIAILIMTKYLMDWYRKKKYFEIITERVKDLKEPWLIAELLPVSYTIEDEIYQELLRKVGSSAIEEIHKIEDEQKEYEDYIEQWIHEVKTPITSIHLMLENRISENPGLKRDLNVELSRLENDVELALYYARSEQIYRDYLIQKLNFRKVLLKVVNKNRTVIMNSSVAIDLDCDEALYAYGDEKWLVFMLTQVLLNAIKYKAEADAKVVMRAKRDNKRIVLNIIDNGKDQNQDANRHQDQREGTVAAVQARILPFAEIHLRDGHNLHLLRKAFLVKPEALLEKRQDIIRTRFQIGSGLQQHECYAGAGIPSTRLRQRTVELSHPLDTQQQVHIRDNRPFDIFHDPGDRNARRIADTDALPDRVLFAEQLARVCLRNNGVIDTVQKPLAVAVQHLEGKDIEESGIDIPSRRYISSHHKKSGVPYSGRSPSGRLFRSLDSVLPANRPRERPSPGNARNREQRSGRNSPAACRCSVPVPRTPQSESRTSTRRTARRRLSSYIPCSGSEISRKILYLTDYSLCLQF